MRTGTFWCWLFGHKFIAETMVYEPHYLDNVKKGLSYTLTLYDYHKERRPGDHCIRCGIAK